ncbi:mannan endo-1,4-beta-mannosidase [Paenibacillus forsythiae]|uniref:Mannan endo-1,4-beta-mannosidase n=1 Tax=Paenibacillus forsythiae TaxID=365616 RepID=A0ABU3H8N5_9BACL|nr:glycosyl hydrolase [Paenibacillus forsythiae]MDT3426377.1 mannan endo-1,4-beta-mannosidase [Paenibacillus forsythiae]
MEARKRSESVISSMEPVNPDISIQARSLLERLYAVRGKGILTGQHEYLEAPYTYSEHIKVLTGVYPALKGVEFGGITGQTAEQLNNQRQNVVTACESWHAAGGLLTASYHAAYPGASPLWEQVQRKTTQAEFDQIITPGTEKYSALLADIDSVAVYLKQLRDAGIPLLWRPYHEMNGDWFWWGRKNNFSALWEIMYDRFVRYHGLNNLLWVWSANANNQWSDEARRYYVGHNRADVIGMDIYNNDYRQDYYLDLRDIGEGKPIAITENGQLPNMANLRTRQPQYSWFLTWGRELTKNNSDAAIQNVFHDPYALSRGEEPSPPDMPPPDTTVGDGLLGNYYIGKDFNTLRLTKVIPVVDFNWKKNTPVGNYTMSIRWTGFIKQEYTEMYVLYTNASDGVRLYIDGRLMIDNWTVQSTTEKSAALPLEAGKYYYIELEYFNNGDPEAVIQLLWSSGSQSKEVIPQSRLYSR